MVAAAVALLAGCHLGPVAPLQTALPSPEIRMTLVYPMFLVDAQAAQRYRLEGLNYRRNGSLDAAIAAFKLGVALDPFNPDGHVLLGWTQHLSGSGSFAAQTLRSALERFPEHVPALNALGIVYLVQGDLQQAIATHTRAIELKPDNEIAHYNLALAYQRLPDFKAAITHGQRAVELEPVNPHPWVALALAQWTAGNQTQAVEAYRQAVSIDGRYRSASHLSHLEQAGFSAAQIAATEELRQESGQKP